MLAATIGNEFVALGNVVTQGDIVGGLSLKRFKFFGCGEGIFFDGLEQFSACFVGQKQFVLSKRLIE